MVFLAADGGDGRTVRIAAGDGDIAVSQKQD